MEPPARSFGILYVGTLPPHPGGTAIVGGQLVAGFAQCGHRVRAVAPITAAALHNGDQFAKANPAVDIIRFVVPYFETSPNHPPPDEYREAEGMQVRSALHRLVAEARPDIVVIGRETYAWHVPDLAIRHGLPTVLLVQNAAIAGDLMGNCPDAMRQRLRAQIRKADCVVLVARHLTECFRWLGSHCLRVVQNGVDLQQFVPRPRTRALQQDLAIANDAIVVAHVSNLKDLKRPLDIVQSAEEALQQNPKLVYVIVGDGSFRRPMEEACRQKRLTNHFRFIGWVGHDVVSDYLNLADVVVMPSETEALALVYLETMACGRLLVASDIPSAREVIVDGENGLLFRKADVGGLTAKTLSAASDPARRAAIGRRAREMVQAYALPKVVNAYVSVIGEVIQQHSHGSAMR